MRQWYTHRVLCLGCKAYCDEFSFGKAYSVFKCESEITVNTMTRGDMDLIVTLFFRISASMMVGFLTAIAAIHYGLSSFQGIGLVTFAVFLLVGYGQTFK
jgi:hypothetical protein